MSALRSALAVATTLVLAVVIWSVLLYRQAAVATPAAAMVVAVQDHEAGAAAWAAADGWRECVAVAGSAPPAVRPVARPGGPPMRALADDAATLLRRRATGVGWWSLFVVVSLAFGLALAPGGTFLRSPASLALPITAAAGAGLTWWLELQEARALRDVVACAGGAPGLWRVAKLSALVLTTAMQVIVVAGALRAWLEQFRPAWRRGAQVLGEGFDRLVGTAGKAAPTGRRGDEPRTAAPDADAAIAAASVETAVTPHARHDTSFRGLMDREWAGILEMRGRVDGRAPDTATAGDYELGPDTPADEPYVCFRSADLTGVALSGGGIRSATFNLGLLQGLHHIGLLPRVDYLSTVSGGGYIGAFWSNWLTSRRFDDAASPATLRDIFPARRPAGDGSHLSPTLQLDSEQERHLREFGRFLAPRVGLLEVETWTALVAAIAGLLPALAIALSLVGIALITWLLLTLPLGATSPWPSRVTMLAITLVVFAVFELLWQKVKLPLQDQSDARVVARTRDYAKLITFSLLGLVIVGVLHAARPAVRAWWRTPAGSAAAVVPPLPSDCTWVAPSASAGGSDLRRGADLAAGARPADAVAALPVRYVAPQWELVCPGADAWWRIAGLRVADVRPALVSPSLFDYTWVWLAAALVLLVLRLVQPLFPLGEDALWVAPLDRVIMRLLGLGTVWAGAAGIWHLALNLDALVVSASGAIASAGLFALLRNWIGVALQKPDRPGAVNRLAAVLPQLLAYLTLLLTIASVGQGLVRWCGDDWPAWWFAASTMVGLLVLGVFIDPAEFGLHAFYRARISRAYAGASNLAPGETAAGNRQTDPRPGDDPPLASLVARPLHLVCCAANDLNGDDIGTLGRGARSAVLSRYGLALGRFATPRCPPVSLGAAVTASAAAFNSNMGDVSSKLGPAVSFVMTALNLRLGLWLRHPLAHAATTRRWPGLLLYREYFGMTSASGQIASSSVAGAPGGATTETAPRHMRDVHLSDGGHFENLAVYELVRRHCRYILVSDCGADPTIAFDDLGRALRRIRQDFGVDITIDVEPLRPDANGHSRQHVAVGRIHYTPTDIGILLYVKPTLTGDELADVLQYKTRNGAFPHEGTGDQFYDEAQWESYRRLGRHVADTVFAFVPPAADPTAGSGVSTTSPSRPADAARIGAAASPSRRLTADWVFGEAAARWSTTPGDLEARVLEMTARVADLELDLQQSGAQGLLREVFPELDDWTRVTPAPGSPPRPAPAPAAPDGADLIAILRVTQMMEDVWMACDLDAWWSHPLNMGWVNFFARWVTAPTFRFWWPLIGPMYSKGFRDFVDDRFPMPGSRAARGPVVPWRGQVVLVAGAHRPTGLAATWWETRSAQRCPWRAGPDGEPPVADVRPPVYYENLLTLERPARGDIDVQVGLVAVWDARCSAGAFCLWTSDDFFVPPSLWGASLGWYFLRGLLDRLADDYIGAVVVVRGPRPSQAHRVASEDTRSFVDQYRKIGFRQRAAGAIEPPLPPEVRAVLSDLQFDEQLDTLLELRFPRPKAPRVGA